MDTKRKVNLFLIILGFVAILMVAYALDKYKQHREEPIYPKKDYTEQIQMLNDTIQVLKKDIENYKAEIELIYLERVNIKKELTKILRDNEKIDTELADGDLDYNIEFLTKYLSEKGTDWERHNSSNNETTADSDKQVTE